MNDYGDGELELQEVPLTETESCTTTTEPDGTICLGTVENPQPAVVLVIKDPSETRSQLCLAAVLKALKLSTFTITDDDKEFMGVYLTKSNCESLAEEFSFHLTFHVHQSGGNRVRWWTRVFSIFSYGSNAYRCFTRTNYTTPFNQKIRSAFAKKDLNYLHSSRVQAELIYNVLKRERILSTDRFGIVGDFVPHSREIKKFQDNLSLFPGSFPLAASRDYFGEEICFVYAWSNLWRYFGLFPISLFGIIVLIYGGATGSDTANTSGLESKILIELVHLSSNDATQWYLFFMLVWIGVFQYQWTRISEILSLQWGVADFKQEEETIGKPKKKTTRFNCIGLPNIFLSLFGFLITSLFTLAIFVISEIVIKIQMYKIEFSGYLAEEKSTLISLVCSLIYTILNTLLGSYFLPWFTKLLTKWENHRFETFYTNSMIMKSTGYYLMSSYMYLLYLIFGVNTGNSIRAALNTSLEEGGYPGEECDAGTCSLMISGQLIIQIFLLRSPIIFKTLFYWLKSKIVKADPKSSDRDLNYILKNYTSESFMDPHGWALWMTDRVLMYGYITMFSYHMPIVVPFAAVLEAIVTQHELGILMKCRRPQPRRCGGIRQWEGILHLINVMSIIVNCYSLSLTHDGTGSYVNILKGLIFLPILIIIFSLVHIQGTVSGDAIQAHQHRQYDMARQLWSERVQISTTI